MKGLLERASFLEAWNMQVLEWPLTGSASSTGTFQIQIPLLMFQSQLTVVPASSLPSRSGKQEESKAIHIIARSILGKQSLFTVL